MTTICPHDVCTGCKACYNICAHSAISFKQDELGFYYPTIDSTICVDCGLCKKVCPAINLVSSYERHESYVATAKSLEEQWSSTSGGIASVLSRYVLHNNGVVYGCTAEDCTHVRHIRISKEEDLSRIKGSKYVQSDIGECFRYVREDLKTGILVLFVGTPCQIAGLRLFLLKQYENLICIDLICHGVPSQKILTDAIKHNLKRNNINGYSVDFRFRKKNGKSLYGIRVKDKENVIYKKKWPNNDYITGFLKGAFYRESCYICKYATKARVSDITIGDYWDYSKKNNKLHGKHYGLSSLVANTDKGKELIENVSTDILLQRLSFTVLSESNAQLVHPYHKTTLYNRFKRIYTSEGYSRASSVVLSKEMIKTKLSKLENKIIKYIKIK